jgi:hypothetical protein
MTGTWLDYAGSTIRADKELSDMIATAIRVSGGSCPMGVVARNDEEKARLLELLRGKHGSKMIDVKTAAELDAAHRKAMTT